MYVDPKAESPVNASEAEQLQASSRAGSPEVYIAVLPKAAADNNGGVDKLPAAIGEAMGTPGVVAVVAGTSFRVGNSSGLGFADNQVKAISTDAFNANNPGQNGGKVTPMLDDFIKRVHAAPKGQSAAARAPASTPTGEKDKGMSGLAILLWVKLGLAHRGGRGVRGRPWHSSAQRPT